MVKLVVLQVKFVGESVDDCGGGYSESIAEMCEELTEGERRLFLPLFIDTPNARHQALGMGIDAGSSQDDCLLLNPSPLLKVHLRNDILLQ